MLLIVTLLLVTIVPSSLSQECHRVLIQNLPEPNFEASSEANKATKASNVRFSSEGTWCPKTSDRESSVTVDLGCVQPVCGMKGLDPRLLLYSIEGSNDTATWEVVTSRDEEFYYSNLKMFEANREVSISPQVQARYFRFKIGYFTEPPCFKVELQSLSEGSVQPIGCFLEARKKKERVMPVSYHIVKNVDTKNPDVSAIYEECRKKAEERSKPLEVFGIRNFRVCVTTKPGGEDQFSKYGKSTKCALCQGRGIGARKFHMFVYKRNV